MQLQLLHGGIIVQLPFGVWPEVLPLVLLCLALHVAAAVGPVLRVD